MKSIQNFSIKKIFFFISMFKSFLCFQNNEKILYCFLPNFCMVHKLKKVLFFKLNLCYFNIKKIKVYFKIFFIFFLQIIKKLQNKVCSSLFLRGSGWGFFLECDADGLQRLEFRLGFSKRVFLCVPRQLQVYISKKRLLVEGFDGSLVGSFISLIQKYKKPNFYTGRGFWKQHQKCLLRQVKKIR